VRPKAGWYNQPIGCSTHGGETHRPCSKEEEVSWIGVRRAISPPTYGFTAWCVIKHMGRLVDLGRGYGATTPSHLGL
jgi:hypothetical protein